MIIAVDFDGTIVEHKYPKIGKEIPFAIDTLKKLKEEKNLLILWTVREGKLLDEAVEYCKERGLEFYAVNSNYTEETKVDGTFSRKIKADIFIDDRNIGGLPDWGMIYEMINKNISYEEVMNQRESIMIPKKRESRGLFASLFKSFIVIALLSLFTPNAFAQSTYGMSGLIHTPSAEMQRDKTAMIGGNFLSKELTPPTWDYDTFNYYLNVTILPFLEVSYTCVGFKIDGKFTQKDRYFSGKLRLLKEGQLWKDMPAIAIGASDPYSGASNEANPADGNGYFCVFYIAATKHINIGSEQIGVNLSYLYNRRDDYKLNGPAGGLTYNPSFLKQLRLIAEYDSKDFAVGASCLLFNHLELSAEMQRMKFFSGGVAYKIYL